MRVVVLFDVGVDVRVPPERDPRSGRVREEWLVREIDPSSEHALDLALGLKAGEPDTTVTLVHLGPPKNEPWLRRALARGCDRAIRIWDDQAAETRAAGKAMVLAAAVGAAGYDLILTGTAGAVDDDVGLDDGQLGVLLATSLGVPCVTQVAGMALVDRGESLNLTRSLDRGYLERVEARPPFVATACPAGAAVCAAGTTVRAAGVAARTAPPGIPVAALLAAQNSDVAVWDLGDLGVPWDRLRRADRSFEYGTPRPRRPRLHPLVQPDPALPAFERIQKLVQGSVHRREGRIVTQPAEVAVEEVFRTLVDEGWLDHLRPGGRSEFDGGEAPAPGASNPRPGASNPRPGGHW